MNKKKVIIIILIIGILATGGWFSYKYFTREKNLEKIPSTYENLQWGSNYDQVYNDACKRFEVIKSEKDLADNKIITTQREGFEDVDGKIKIQYIINKEKGLTDITITFKKDDCKQSLQKIYNNYKKRLDKYCSAIPGVPNWKNSEGITYYLDNSGESVLLALSLLNES